VDGPAIEFDGKRHIRLGAPYRAGRREGHRQDGPRLGTPGLSPTLPTARGRPDTDSQTMRRAAVAPTRVPSLASSPLTRTHPQLRFSLPGRMTSKIRCLQGPPAVHLAVAPVRPATAAEKLPCAHGAGLRLDQEGFSTRSRDRSGERNQEDAVCRPVAGPAFDLALKDLQL
jgi:hypothetical protein